MFFRWLASLFASAPAAPMEDAQVRELRPASFFTSDMEPAGDRTQIVEAIKARSVPVTPDKFRTYDANGMPVADSTSGNSLADSAKAVFTLAGANVPDAQLLWYASQGFIGFQLCAILAQHWLVQKACDTPARDAIRNGYRVTINTPDVDAKMLDKLRAADKRHGIKAKCRELVRFARVFGIRIALFKVDSPDPKYYENPFNPDGITPGSYRGVVQVDPYWCIPELSTSGATDPASADFYEPTYWTIRGKRYHRSHLVIVRGPEVPDLLKPSYQFAGISLPQRIYERVYAAERTANEGPQLALTKRATFLYTDTGKALANEEKFTERLLAWCGLRDNYGVKVLDKDGDKAEQFDTALGDFDTVMMGQYQLVAAIANVPATKLLGTTPKGFNASGDYEAESYHEELESIQTNDMEPFINRHHLCVIRSELAPAAGIRPFSVAIEWEPTDTPSAKEEAEIRKLNADTHKVYVDAGAVDGQDVRTVITGDPKSGYDGLPILAPEPEPEPAPMPPPVATTALDSADWNPVTGVYAEAELVTNQRHLSHEIVAQKIAAQDFTVQLSPEFQTATGKRFRVIIDGHHSLQAAVESGNVPVFVEANYADSDYGNVVTRLPMSGTEAVV
jgi:phage-related protein (TIGR01555 family)